MLTTTTEKKKAFDCNGGESCLINKLLDTMGERNNKGSY